MIQSLAALNTQFQGTYVCALENRRANRNDYIQVLHSGFKSTSWDTLNIQMASPKPDLMYMKDCTQGLYIGDSEND